MHWDIVNMGAGCLKVEEHLAGFGLDSNLASHTRTVML